MRLPSHGCFGRSYTGAVTLFSSEKLGENTETAVYGGKERTQF
jgi:hypothetical protein